MPEKNPSSIPFPEQLSAFKNNNQLYLGQLYAQNYPVLERYVLQNNGSEAEAKDIFQEAFIAVWRNIKLEKFTPGSEQEFQAYLFRVGKNKWISHLRSSGYKDTVRLSENEVEIEDDIDRDDSKLLQAVGENFKQLGANCRELLTQFYYRRQSLKIIANLFGWTEATARNNKYRCLEKLRTLLKDQNIKVSE